MPTGNLDTQKRKMRTKYDLILDQNNQKQKKLEDLYLQLGQVAYFNMEGEQTKHDIQKKMKDFSQLQQSPQLVYQSKITDSLMYAGATQRAFHFQDIESVIERVEVLNYKTNLSEQRCKEAEMENAVSQKVLKGL
jgi:hypothetical protein